MGTFLKNNQEQIIRERAAQNRRKKRGIIFTACLVVLLGAAMLVPVFAQTPDEEPTLTQIEIVSLPDKVEYLPGEPFEAIGLQVNAIYSNATTRLLTDAEYALSQPDMETAGEKAVTVSVKQGESRQESSFAIRVLETVTEAAPETKNRAPASATLEGLKIMQEPAALSYTSGDVFDPTGLKAMAVYSDENTRDLSLEECVISAPDMNRAGEQIVTVAYTEGDVTVSDTFQIEISHGIMTMDLIDLDETLIHPMVNITWRDPNKEQITPQGSTITVQIWDMGPQNSYSSWTLSQNRLGTSVNTVSSSGNGNAGMFQNIIMHRNKKVTVSGVPRGYHVLFNNYETSCTYASGTNIATIFVHVIEDGEATLVLDGIEMVGPTSIELDINEPLNLTDRVLAYYTDEVTERILDPDELTVSELIRTPAMIGPTHQQTLTISYTENGITKTTTLRVILTASTTTSAVPTTPKPSETPTTKPTETPTTKPTETPTTKPTETPTTKPTETPTTKPTVTPTTKPTETPTTKPTESPTTKPTESPTTKPTESPTTKPTESPTTEKTPVELAITRTPKNKYEVGDSLDTSALEATVTYSDDSTQVLTDADVQVSTPDMSTPGSKTVTVSFTSNGETVTKTFDIQVTPAEGGETGKTPVELAITRMPKNQYEAGDSLDMSDFGATVTYSDDSTQVLTGADVQVSTPDMSTPGSKTVTVSFTSNGETVTKTFEIQVTPAEGGETGKTPARLVITRMPKDRYYVGNRLDLSDFEAMAVYSDDSTQVLTDADVKVSTPNMSSPGTKTVTVSFTLNGTTVTESFPIQVMSVSSDGTSGKGDYPKTGVEEERTAGFWVLFAIGAAGVIALIIWAVVAKRREVSRRAYEQYIARRNEMLKG